MNAHTAPQPASTTPKRAGLARFASIILASIFVIGCMPGGATPAGEASLDSLYAGMPQPEAFAVEPSTDSTVQTQEAVNHSLSATKIRFRAGTHRLFKLNTTTGSVTKTRIISLGSPAAFATPHTLRSFGGSSYARLDSGTYAGWWVATPAVAPSYVVTFSQPTEVRLAKGTRVGVRFYANRRLAVRRSATLSEAATYSVRQQATFGTKTFFYLTSGPLAERWIAKSSYVDLVSAAAAPVQPATWKSIMLIYRDTDVAFTRSDGSTYRLKARMNNSMYDLARKITGRFVSSISNWSAGYAAIDVTVVDVPRTLTSIDALSNGKYWVGPKSVRSDLDTYAPSGRYDSIFVLFQHKDSAGVTIPMGGWGMAVAPGSWSNGAGYASIHTPTEAWWWTDKVNPEEVFVHEWMHQVLFFHENAGRIKLDLHAASQYGYQASSGSWKTWLSDVMLGRVQDGSKLLGVNYEMWRAGTPTQPQGWTQ